MSSPTTLLDQFGIDPLPITYAIDGLTFNGLDAQGNLWLAQKTDGWHNAPGARARRSDRPNGHGAFRGVAWREPRIITLQGKVYSPDVAGRNTARDTFNALCSDPGRLYELRVTDQTNTSQITHVELDSTPKFELVQHERRADFQIQFAAPDPRKHSFAWQDPILNPAGASFSGLEFADPGLSFDLDFGTTTTAGTAQVANYGTAPAYPLFTLTGPLSQPTIVHLDSGRTISYASEIATGERISINCDEFPQRGIPPHGRISSTRGNVGALCTIGTEWPVVNPQTTASFALRGGGSPSAQLMCSLRSAFW